MDVEKAFYVYIMSDRSFTNLQTGVSHDLSLTIALNRERRPFAFLNKSDCPHLVYYEGFRDQRSAVEREKQIRSWSRRKKADLVRAVNPDGMDLSTRVLTMPPPTHIFWVGDTPIDPSATTQLLSIPSA